MKNPVPSLVHTFNTTNPTIHSGAPHPVLLRCFIDGGKVVLLVFLCLSTNQTDELLVVPTEELELLVVLLAPIRSSCRWSLTRLLPQDVRQVPQRKVTRGPSHRQDLHAERTLLYPLSPPRLETALTEAVSTQQDHGVLVYLGAQRASASLLWLGYFSSHLSSVCPFPFCCALSGTLLSVSLVFVHPVLGLVAFCVNSFQ